MPIEGARELIIGRIKWHIITIWIYPDHNNIYITILI
jgi:hypothetical protein